MDEDDRGAAVLLEPAHGSTGDVRRVLLDHGCSWARCSGWGLAWSCPSTPLSHGSAICVAEGNYSLNCERVSGQTGDSHADLTPRSSCGVAGGRRVTTYIRRHRRSSRTRTTPSRAAGRPAVDLGCGGAG